MGYFHYFVFTISFFSFYLLLDQDKCDEILYCFVFTTLFSPFYFHHFIFTILFSLLYFHCFVFTISFFSFYLLLDQDKCDEILYCFVFTILFPLLYFHCYIFTVIFSLLARKIIDIVLAKIVATLFAPISQPFILFSLLYFHCFVFSISFFSIYLLLDQFLFSACLTRGGL